MSQRVCTVSHTRAGAYARKETADGMAHTGSDRPPLPQSLEADLQSWSPIDGDSSAVRKLKREALLHSAATLDGKSL